MRAGAEFSVSLVVTDTPAGPDTAKLPPRAGVRGPVTRDLAESLAWLGLIVFVAPILIHITSSTARRAVCVPDASLHPARDAARRGSPSRARGSAAVDRPRGMLAVAIGAGGAAAATTRPLCRQSWNARTVRAIVANRANAAAESPAFRSQTFEASNHGMASGAPPLWLERAPPARRELVVAAPLALGSIGAGRPGCRAAGHRHSLHWHSDPWQPSIVCRHASVLSADRFAIQQARKCPRARTIAERQNRRVGSRVAGSAVNGAIKSAAPPEGGRRQRPR